MEHNWDLYFDTSNPFWSKLQKIYKDNDSYPKVITKGRNLHHKFMRSFSKLEGNPIDNDKDNLVSLSLPDHLRVHFYLYKCTKVGFRNRTAAPVRFMLKKALSYVTEETIEQIIEDWDYSFLHENQHRTFSEEARRKMSEAHKGKPTKNKGKHRSEETKRKISETLKGQPAWNKGIKQGPHSEEWKRKVSEKLKGHHHTEESKRKMSEAMKGKSSWTKGLHWYNNGFENIRCADCPDGYVPGRLKFN